MVNNIMAGLASVSSTWTHQNPRPRPNPDAANPPSPSTHRSPSTRVYNNELNALIQNSRAALERIEVEQPQELLPSYNQAGNRESRAYDYDGESIVTPLTRSEVGSVRSNWSRASRWTNGAETEVEGLEGLFAEPEETAVRSVRSTADLGEFPGELHLHALASLNPSVAGDVTPEPEREDQRDSLQRSNTTASAISRFFLALNNDTDPTLTQLSLPPPGTTDEIKVEEEEAPAEEPLSEKKSNPLLRAKKRLSPRHLSREVREVRHAGDRDPAPAYPGSIIEAASKPEEPAAPAAPTHPGDPEDEVAYIDGFKLVVLIFALSSAVFLVAMDVNIIATAIPNITADFNSLDNVGWYGSAYLMTTCSFQILFGRIYTFFPTKWVFMSAIFIFEIGSLMAGVAPNSSVFIAGRAIQGTGTSGIISGALIIISQVVPLHQRPRIGGVVGSMEGIAMISAPILGGFLTNKVSWRLCFYINLPVGGFVLAVVLFYLRTPPPPIEAVKTWSERLHELDLVGTALLIPAIVCLLLAFEWGGTKYNWHDLGIVALFILAFVLLGMFTYFQCIKGDRGTIPPRIIKKRSILAGAFYSMCTSAGLVVMTYYLPLWFQAIKGVSASKSGIMILPLLIGVILAVVISGALVSAIGYYTPFMILGSVLMSVGSGLMSTYGVGTGQAVRILFPAMFGAGVGTGFQQPMIAAQTVLSGRDVPIGTSIMVFAQTFGGSLALSIAQAVFNNRLLANIKKEHIEGIDISKILEAGATTIRHMVDPDDAGKILSGYNKAITQTFYVALTAATISIVGALAMEWKSVKKQEKKEGDERA